MYWGSGPRDGNLLARGDPQVENLTDILFANGMTGACTEGERFKARKLDSHTFGQ